MDNEKMPKNAEFFHCKKCDFICSKQSNYIKHISTAKHKRITMDNEKMPKNAGKEFVCACGNSYKYSSGLCKHKRRCTFVNDDTIDDVKSEGHISSTQMMDVMEMMMTKMTEMNKELINDVIVPNIQNVQNTTNNNNTTNNTNNININVFLNEQCKDAMNLTDFIDSIQLSIEDVVNIGEQGQTSGFANILIDKLKAVDLYKRPLHCSDAKRETLYVKNNDEWNKEADDRPQIQYALDHISRKGLQKVPDLDLPNDKITDTMFEIVKTPVNHKKIVSKIAKEIKI